MEHGGYIRRFVSQGMRRCYPILIHKFPVTQGEHNGEVLDALSSTKQDGCLELRYISCEVHGEVDGEVHGEVHASQRRNDTGKGTREKKKEAPAAPSLSFAGQHFSVTTKQDALLGEAFPWIDRPAEYRLADSWMEANPARRPKRLTSRFLHNWFARKTQPKGGSNGKDVNAAVETTMRGFAANNRIPS
jgi:hypothetical protein